MKADITFANVAFEAIGSGQRIRVRKGETFAVNLLEVGETPIQWATTNDPVLKVLLAADNLGAVVDATAIGTSEVQIQNFNDRSVAMYLTIEVFDNTAASLNISAGSPELK